ncbi:MAG: sporulation protein Cse60 [Paludibacteraceae bacterium]|nr:sporulation protein Cse60 [Paludibacteraceae bacterium]
MIQVKLFQSGNSRLIEEEINQFLQENANSIKVVDIKYTTYVPSERLSCAWTAMVIYETL